MKSQTMIAAALATTLLLAGCGGDDAGGEMRATMTDEECAYEGDTSPAEGTFTIAVENRTAYIGAFAVAALRDGATTEELEPFVEVARRQFEQSGQLPDPPPFYSQVDRVSADAGMTRSLAVEAEVGTYALMCFIDEPPTWRAFVAAQLDVR